METTIAGRHFALSNWRKTQVTRKLRKLERYYQPLIDAHVTITQDGPLVRTDLIVNVHGQALKAEGEHLKTGPSVEQALDRMERQLRRLHDKRRRRRPARERAGIQEVAGGGE